MQKELVIELVFTAVEMAQSISIGLFLLFISFKRQRNLSLLGIFLVVLGLSFVMDLLESLGYNQHYPIVSYWSSAFLFLTPMLLYNYVHSLLISPRKRIRKILLGLGSIGFVVGLTAIFFGLEEVFSEVYEGLSVMYLFFVFLMIIIQIVKHNKKVREQYSYTKPRVLNWILYLTAYFFAGFFLLGVLVATVNFTVLAESIIFSVFSLVWLLGMAYSGLFYQTSKDLWMDSAEVELTEAVVKKQAGSVNREGATKGASEADEKPDAGIQEMFERIKEKVATEQLFLNTDLTITDVAQQVKEHPKTVSKVINEQAGQNFNSFINFFRVRHAQELLKNPENRNISIDGIGKMAGFRSNSAFYTAFKKALNITPLQYQKGAFPE